MLSRIRAFLNRQATGRNIFIYLVIFIFFNAVVLSWAGGRIEAISSGVGPIDLLFSYTPDQAYEMVEAYGEEGRSFYAAIELTADVIYPLVIFLLFGSLLAYFTSRAFPADSPVQKFVALPVLGLVTDYLENIGIVSALLTYPSRLDTLVQFANVFTMLKWLSAGLTILLIVVGLIALLVKRISAR
jgi:hypothetical protein